MNSSGFLCIFDHQGFNVFLCHQLVFFLLQTHKKVSKKMYKGWDKYCKEWRDDNASNSECNRIKGWLNGDHLEDARPCQTVCRRDNDLELPPYRVYSRYSVSIHY